MRRTNLILCYITASNEEEARKLVQILIQEKLIACANIIKDISSLYIYQNKLNDEKEVLILAKTRAILFDRVAELVKEYHSYSTPCIIALPIIGGSDEFINWVEEETKNTSIF